MTTNSPNPVDGDVQALIALALRISAMPLKKVSETVICPSLYSSVSTAEIHGIATALVKVSHGFTSKAEKITEHSGCGRGTQVDVVTVRMRPGEVVVKISEGDYNRLSTTQPAQILRPVELPESQRLCNGYYFDMNDVFEALEEAGVPFKVKS